MSTRSLSELIFNQDILTKEESESFCQLLTESTIRKGANLTIPGDDPDRFFLIKKGVIRNFYIDTQGKEHTKKFQGAGGIIGPYVEYLTKRRTIYYIQAVTHCVVESFSIKKFYKLTEGNPHWIKVRALLAEASFIDKEEREIMMLTMSVCERFEQFQKRYKPFMDQIPKFMIASYIGSTPEGLSRTLKVKKDNIHQD